MSDLAHVFGEDLQLGLAGDLALVAGPAETQQRVLHRLLTSAGTYIWQLSYGASLPTLVGSVVSQQQVAAIIRAQMKYEAAVAVSPEPEVILSTGILGVTSAAIKYMDNDSGISQVLALPIGD